MGGIGFEIPFEVVPKDGAALQLAVWNGLARHITGRLVGSKAGRSIIESYAAMQASDGLDESEGGDWFAGKSALFFFFGDAAGLCYLEQHATCHWAALATLDAWDEIGAIAKQHGAKLGAPSKLVSEERTKEDARAILKRLVTEKQREVFFMLGSGLAYARAEPAPAKDHQIFVQGKIKELGKLPAADRERVRGLLAEGRCHCEACQKVRANEGLPLVGSPTKATASAKAKAKATATPPAGVGLEAATIVTERNADALRRSKAVALDLGLPWNAKGNVDPAIFPVLPSLPLRALSLVNHQLRALPPEVTACTGLEVLSLAGTRRIKIGKALADLENLRAIEIDYNPRGTKTADFALLCQLPSLEAVDDVIWSGAIPPELANLTRLRSITVSPRGRCRMLEPLPLEAVTTFEAVPEIMDKPLRFYDGPSAGMPRDTSRLELLATDGLPKKARDLGRLRGLVFSGASALPPWVAELPALTFFRALDVDEVTPPGFAALGALTSLRYLVVSANALAGKNDFSKLAALETLVIYGKIAPEHVPKGLRDLPALRAVHYRVAAHERGVEPAELAAQLPPGCALTTDDAVFGVSPWFSPLIWFRALCTDRSDPGWWLSRFDRGEAFEAMVHRPPN